MGQWALYRISGPSGVSSDESLGPFGQSVELYEGSVGPLVG